MNKIVLFLLSLSLFLTGCSSNQKLGQADEGFMQQHTNTLTRLTHWQISGKIRIKTEQDSDSANIVWQQNGQQYRIILSGPLGQTGATIQGSPYQVLLTLPEEAPYSAATPEALLQTHFGWDLPLSHLFYWIRTLPAPGSQYQSETNSKQQLVRMQQNGWEINYDRYHTQLDPELPGRMKINKGNLQLTFIINQWQISDAQLSLLQMQ